MADTDLTFKIQAVDEYKQQLENAISMVDKLSEAERNALQVSTDKVQADQKEAQAVMEKIGAIDKAADQTSQLSKAEQEAAQSTEQAGEAAQKNAQSTNEMGEASGKASVQIGGMQGALLTLNAAMGVAQTAIGTFKQVWDFAKEGAAIQRIGAQFNQVADDFGVNGEKLVAAMDKAAHGTVDDEELMQTATRALTQGVIKSSDDLVKFVEIARASAVRFGGDTTQALQSILYATEVGAQRSLKATIGVVDFTAAYEKLAVSLGKRKQDLTDEEQLQARVNAVLEKGGELVTKVGNASEDAATKMQRLEMRFANIFDEVKSGATNAILPYLDDIKLLEAITDGNATTLEKAQAAYELAADQYGENSDLARGLRAEVERLTKAEKDSADAAEAATRAAYGQNNALDESNRAAQRAANAQDDLKQKMLEVEQGARNQADTYSVLDAAMSGTAAKSALLASQQRMIAQDMSDLKTAMTGQLQNEFQGFNEKQDDLATKAAKVREELDKLEASQGKVATGTKKHAMSAAEATLANLQLAKAQDELSRETAKGTLTTEQIAALQDKVALNKEKLSGVTKKEIEDNKQLTAASVALKDAQAQLASNTDPMKQAELAVKVENLKEKLGAASGAVVNYIDNSKRIKELQGQYDEINKEIEANAAAHEEATKRILFGYAEQAIAQANANAGIKGFTEAESQALDALAVKWGLKSQEDITAMQNIRTAAQELAQDGSIEAFTATVGANLDDVNAKYEKTQGKIEDVGKAQSAINFLPPSKLKVDADTKPAEESVAQMAQRLLTNPITIKAQIQAITADDVKAVAGDTFEERKGQIVKAIQSGTADTEKQAVKSSSNISTVTQTAINSAAEQASKSIQTVGHVGEESLGKLKTAQADTMTSIANSGAAANRELATADTWISKIEGEHVIKFVVRVSGDQVPTGAGTSSPIPIGGFQQGGPINREGLYQLHSNEFVLSEAMRYGRQPIPPQALPFAARGGDTIINNNNFYDAMSTKLWQEKQRLDRVQSVAEAM